VYFLVLNQRKFTLDVNGGHTVSDAKVFECSTKTEGLNPHRVTSAYHIDVHLQGGPMPTNYSNELTTITRSMLTLEFEERPTAKKLLQSDILQSQR